MPIIATMTADGTIDAFDLHNNVVSVYGDFGGGTLTLRKKFAGTFYDMQDYDSTPALELTSAASALIHGHHTCDFSLDASTGANIVIGIE